MNKVAFFIDSETEVVEPLAKVSNTNLENHRVDGGIAEEAEALDHMIEREGFLYAGSHIVADFYGTKDLTSIEKMEKAFRFAIKEAGATLLHMHFHKFSPSGGISGVAVLSESHISVHTWPEHDFAAFDIFMCGSAQPLEALKALRVQFQPKKVQYQEHLRGRR